MTGAPKLGPELAVVVIGLRAPAELADAIASLQSQGTALEIVVVNSGGGDAAALLEHRGIAVPVVERADVTFPGAARNLGIVATRARWVAFLESDCRAGPGWAEARLAAHRGGAAAVATALLNSAPRSIIAWASHLSLHVRRLPGTPPALALTYGASYDRALFERYGMFREDLRTGEDTEFHERLPPGDRPFWVPAVRTVHRTPTRLGWLLADQFARGRLSARAWRSLARVPRARVAWGAVQRVPMIMRLSWRAVDAADRSRVVAAWAILPLAALAYALGALTGGVGTAIHRPPSSTCGGR